MCFSLFKPPLIITPQVMSPAQVQTLLYSYGIKIPMGMLDGMYYSASAEDWAEVLSRLVASAWAYKAETNDCDNIALEAMTTCSREYGLNTMGMAIGNIPSGRHAFCLFIVHSKYLWVFEPQKILGEQYWPIGGEGYTVDMALI